MLVLEIQDVKMFMSDLLMKETFDRFAVESVEIQTSCLYRVEGRYQNDWWEDIEEKPVCLVHDNLYCTWSGIRSQVFGIIKGKQSPSLMHIVLLAPERIVEQMLQKAISYRKEEILSLGIRISFEQGKLRVMSGCTIGGFRLDKEMEHEWDEYLLSQFKSIGVAFEKIVG